MQDLLGIIHGHIIYNTHLDDTAELAVKLPILGILGRFWRLLSFGACRKQA